MRRQIDHSLLEMALVGYRARREEVVRRMAEIERQLGAASASVAERTGEEKPKHKMSTAGRRAIAAAQRKRWAASRKSVQSPKTPPAPKAKRRLSKAGRAAIVAATKRRWALKRAEAAKAAKSAGKKAAAKVVARKAAPKKSLRAKAANGSSRKTVKKPAPRTPRPAAAGPAPIPEVVAP